MTRLLEHAGTSFLRAFGGALLILAPGVLWAPDLSQAKLLGTAALVSALTAGLRAIQVFVPKLSFDTIMKQPWATWVDSFSRAFLGTLIVLLTGWLGSPDLSDWKAGLSAVLIGAATAGIRALQGLLTPGEYPTPGKGFQVGE